MPYPGYFGQAGCLFSLISPWDAIMVGTLVKILKISFRITGNCLFGVFLVHIFHLSSLIYYCHLCCLFIIKLVVFVLAYSMFNKTLVLKGQKILFWSFLVRLGENFLKFYFLLIGLFFFLVEKINMGFR